MHKLTKTLAAVTLMAPMGVHPLGIGDIELHSALNQRLNAEILLNLSEGESLADVQVSLATPDKFNEVGIPRSYFLSKIKFEPIVKPDGSVVIQLTSTGVVKEPFLDFLLEVSWPKGSLYREFSVLVDPPVTYQQPVIPVVKTPSTTQNTSSKQSSRPSAYTRPATPRSRTPQYQNAQNADQYSVQRNDTLWEIAQRVRADNVSTEQMMIALFDANPQAFYRNNVNTLMLGKTLQIPESSVALRISRAEARAEFDRQTRIWKGGRATASRSRPQQSETENPNANRITLVAPTSVEVADQEIVTPGQVKVDSAVIEKYPANAGAASAQNQAMNERMAKLEQQLQLMQKMLTMRDEQLAILQSELANKGQTSPPKQIEPSRPSGTDKATAKEPEIIVVEESTIESKPAELEAALIKPEIQQPVQEKIPEPVTEPAVTKPPVKKPVPVVQPKPVKQAATKTEADYSLYYMIFGVVGFTMLGLLGWLLWRNKMLDDEDSTESMFAASSEIILPEEDPELTIPVIDDDSTYDVGTVGESSFLSEFIPSDFDAFDTEQAEVDPISEADVYLAYGRYQQAEELMRQAIEDHPERDECKLKLLEIFYSNEDTEAFTSYASELVEQGKKDEIVFWSKVAEMGNEIAPDAEVFASSTPQSSLENDSTEKEEGKVPVIESVNVNDAGTGLDFDLSSLESASSNHEDILDDELEDISGSLESIEHLDDSLGSGTEDKTAVFDFDAGNASSLTDKNSNVATGDKDLNLFEDFDSTADTYDQESNQEKAGNDIDFDFDLDQLPENSTAESTGQLYDLDDMDEFDTKIDLAKAYIDMGDPEAAKAIFEEILIKGNDEQKKEAQTLLDTKL